MFYKNDSVILVTNMLKSGSLVLIMMVPQWRICHQIPAVSHCPIKENWRNAWAGIIIYLNKFSTGSEVGTFFCKMLRLYYYLKKVSIPNLKILQSKMFWNSNIFSANMWNISHLTPPMGHCCVCIQHRIYSLAPAGVAILSILFRCNTNFPCPPWYFPWSHPQRHASKPDTLAEMPPNVPHKATIYPHNYFHNFLPVI